MMKYFFMPDLICRLLHIAFKVFICWRENCPIIGGFKIKLEYSVVFLLGLAGFCHVMCCVLPLSSELIKANYTVQV